MSRLLRDGSATGQEFVLVCDSCGAALTASTAAERERERVDAGWSLSGGAADLCRDCAPKTVDGTARRFRRKL